MEFRNNLENLMQEKEVSLSTLAEKIGYGKTTVYYWLKGEREPSATAVVVLSKFFGVSADYLLGLEDDLGIKKITRSLTESEIALLKTFDRLDAASKNKVIGYCEALSN